MPVPDKEAVCQCLRSWLCQANPAAAAMNLDPDTDIIDSRILESLQVVEFILFLEQKSGRTILVEHLNPATLRTLNSIYATFFEPRP
jgi:acyl carrier protein